MCCVHARFAVGMLRAFTRKWRDFSPNFFPSSGFSQELSYTVGHHSTCACIEKDMQVVIIDKGREGVRANTRNHHPLLLPEPNCGRHWSSSWLPQRAANDRIKCDATVGKFINYHNERSMCLIIYEIEENFGSMITVIHRTEPQKISSMSTDARDHYP